MQIPGETISTLSVTSAQVEVRPGTIYIYTLMAGADEKQYIA